jgi:broad specificity phosphatase PhoE
MNGRNGEEFSVIYLARHGATAWSRAGRHTGLTDLPLTEQGERNARRLGERLKELTFAKVFTSPLRRAMRTGELVGFGPVAEADPDLVEWDYGDYDGRTTVEIRAERADWSLFRDGCPGGESPQQVAARADRVAHRLRAATGDILLFSSRHFMQALAARWIGVEPLTIAESLTLNTSSLSALGYRESLSEPPIRLWNETHYLLESDEQEAGANNSASVKGTQ